MANAWGPGHDREPYARASELPPADPQPRFRGWEAASREGRLKGSSCMNGNIHVQFLGEGVAATPPPYPARQKRGLAATALTAHPIQFGARVKRCSACMRKFGCKGRGYGVASLKML